MSATNATNRRAANLALSPGICLEVVKRLDEISGMNADPRTAWEAITFAKAVLAALDAGSFGQDTMQKEDQ